ncbi:MmgE/PrpD family protein [Shinella sp. HZN7]|uniref:MmgE/PrpD family protein n=1 Tax=Shinella sp. (strain HZN7) TaxID=879274 RepID=UPI0007DAB037|nr:MmgE/PrpD family protein [Shinella sp. HZN7]ANH08931.1 MmgE/PrpD family protein 4 [Shinella sp. HZN7]
MTIAQHLAHFTSTLTRETIPGPVWEKAHACLLNGYGIAIAGLATPYEPVARAAAVAMYGGPGEATFLGSGGMGSVTGAVMANGALFHGRGQEDTCGAAHLGAVMIPLLMALIESGRANMADLIPAMIAGYEVGGLFEELLAGDTTPRGFRATTLFGTGAAAAAVARLYRMDAERTCAALGNAVSFSGGLLQTFAEGTDEWRYQVGATAQAGWTAAELARSGSVSLREAYEGAKGLARAFAGRSLDVADTVAKIGRDWQTLRVAFKPFPVCAFNQTPVTATLSLREKLGGRTIERVVVRMNPYECGYAGMDSKGPFSTIGGTLMSIPFCIAQTLLRGAPSMAMMTQYHDGEINALVERVDLLADEGVPTLCCRIELQLTGGEILTEICNMTASDYAWSFEELQERLVRTAGQEGLPAGCITDLGAFCRDPQGTGVAALNAAFAAARPLIRR